MALVISEDSAKVTKTQIHIPKNAKKVFQAMEKLYGEYTDTVKGGRVLKRLAHEKAYDVKGPDSEDRNGKKDSSDSISVNNAKVILHRQEKFAPNTVQYQLYGGELGHNLLSKGIESARRVGQVDAVKPPKPNAVPKADTLKITSKEIQKPNGTISYTSVTESKKKVKVNESQVSKLIREYRSQLVLPFEHDTPNHDFKVNYEHFIDYLEENGQYGTLPSDDTSIGDLIVANIDDYVLCEFLYTHTEDGETQDFLGFFVTEMINKGYKLEDIFNSQDVCNSVRNAISNGGERYDIGTAICDTVDMSDWNEIFKSRITFVLEAFLHDKLENLGESLVDNFNIDENGLICIERAITLPQLDSKTTKGYDVDYYTLLQKQYKGMIGTCWSWENGDTYDGADYGDGTTTIYLEGKVRPSDVVWNITLRMNLSLDFEGEKEIRVMQNKPVEIYDILDENHNSLKILTKPILMLA